MVFLCLCTILTLTSSFAVRIVSHFSLLDYSVYSSYSAH